MGSCAGSGWALGQSTGGQRGIRLDSLDGEQCLVRLQPRTPGDVGVMSAYPRSLPSSGHRAKPFNVTINSSATERSLAAVSGSSV